METRFTAMPNPWRRTKIVCTLGPASESPEMVHQLIQAGMDVARVNFSHGTHEGHAEAIARVREFSHEMSRSVAVLADLQGPKLRVGELPGGEMELVAGAVLHLRAGFQGEPDVVPVPHPELLENLRPGDVILLDDGVLELRVEGVEGGDAVCRVISGGTLHSRKGISVPGAAPNLPAITEKDRADLRFALEQDVDFVALSFVRRPEDVRGLRALIAAAGRETPIIAKIEKREALDHIEAILDEVDGVMVARGDLGVETPAEEVPLHQKRIIRLARERAKPVITATQMLESMIHNPRPTRAEASDVANAILDGTDAVMLSGETAVGDYPVEALKMMIRIALATERAFPYEDFVRNAGAVPPHSITDAISQATCEIAHELGARAIVPSTVSGYTARMVSRHRPRTPILVCTSQERVCRQMALVWGAQAVPVEEYETTDEMIHIADRVVVACGLAAPGDKIVITAGIPMGGKGKTNMVHVRLIPSPAETKA